MADEWLAQGNKIASIWTADRRRLRPDLLERILAAVAGTQTLWSIARRHGIPIRQIGRLSQMPDLEDHVRATGADVLMTVMTHTIVPPDMLALFHGQAINCHPAMLPHYKGPLPLQSMLFDGCGEVHGGLTLHVLSPGIDEGAIIAQKAIPLRVGAMAEWNAEGQLAIRKMMRNEVTAYFRGDHKAVPQQPGSGNYRKAEAGEFVITGAKSCAECMSLAETLMPHTLFWMPEPGDGARRGVYRVMGPLRHTGPATGHKARIGWLTIGTDVSDGRIAMRRRHRAVQIVAEIQTGLRMRRIFTRSKRGG